MTKTYYKSAEHYLSSYKFDHVRFKINSFVYKQIEPIVNKYTKHELKYYWLTLSRFIEFEFPEIWIDRFELIIRNKKDSSSKESFILRFGEEEGMLRYAEKCKKKCRRDDYIETHGIDKWNELSLKRTTYSLNAQIRLHGEEEGEFRWKEILAKKLETQQKNDLLRQTPRKSGQTLAEFQERLGIEEGYNRWRKKYDLLKYKNSRQRYIDEFGEELGPEICRKVKSNLTISRFTEKYGEIEGPIRFEISKSKCGITLDRMILKYGEEDGTFRYNSWRENSALGCIKSNKNYSKSSQDLFWNIYEILDIEYKSDCYFAELNEEMILYVPKNWGYNRWVIYSDFKCRNSIIEFDGKYWHNPDQDAIRDEIVGRMGYSVLRIDYDEFIKNKKNNIQKCLNFIYETSPT